LITEQYKQNNISMIVHEKSPKLKRAIWPNVCMLKHLALPDPTGGGRSLKSHAAATGVHWKI
jgi:hypothetical protein